MYRKDDTIEREHSRGDEANPAFVYSPMFGIERELGDLQTY